MLLSHLLTNYLKIGTRMSFGKPDFYVMNVVYYSLPSFQIRLFETSLTVCLLRNVELIFATFYMLLTGDGET